MKKKILFVLMCGGMILGATGCGNEVSKNDDSSTSNSSSNMEETKTEKKNKDSIVCTGNPQNSSEKYPSAKSLDVVWTGKFGSNKNLTDASAVYTMTFEKGVSSATIEENKNLLLENYCNSGFHKNTFSNCDVKVENDKVIMNLSFDLNKVESDILNLISKDHDYFYNLIAQKLEKIENKKCVEK